MQTRKDRMEYHQMEDKSKIELIEVIIDYENEMEEIHRDWLPGGVNYVDSKSLEVQLEMEQMHVDLLTKVNNKLKAELEESKMKFEALMREL